LAAPARTDLIAEPQALKLSPLVLRDRDNRVTCSRIAHYLSDVVQAGSDLNAWHYLIEG
jgi:hypothetical protein